MIINIDEEEYELNELISQVQFDIVKLDVVIAGLQDVRDKKADALEWLKPLKEAALASACLNAQ
jgi:hypothetical protein